MKTTTVTEQPKREALETQQRAVLRERDGLQAKLDKARSELIDAQAFYDQQSRAYALGEERAQPMKARADIELIESRIAGLTAMIDEKSALSQKLQSQISPFLLKEAYDAWTAADLRLNQQIAEQEKEINRLIQAVADARAVAGSLIAARARLVRPQGVL